MALMKKSGKSINLPAPVHLPNRQPSASDSSLDIYKAPIVKKPIRKPPTKQSRRRYDSDEDVTIVSVKYLDKKLKPQSAPFESPNTSSRNSPDPTEAVKGSSYVGDIIVPTITTVDRNTSLGLILSMIYGSVHHDVTASAARCFVAGPENLTYKKIAYSLYLLCRIKSPNPKAISDNLFATAIIEYFARGLLESLHLTWHTTKLYKELADLVEDQEGWTFKEKQEHYWPEISKYKIERRLQKPGMLVNIVNGRQSTNSNAPPSTLHISKSLKKTYPYLQPGRRSGKQAGLRLANTPAKRDSEAISSSATPEAEDFGGRTSKKRRRDGTPPEMGPDSDEEAALSLPLRTAQPTVSVFWCCGG